MFESPLLERLSKVRPSLVLLLYVPVVVAFLIYAVLWLQLGLGRVALYFAAGVLFWTIFEWLFHRFVFHFQPNSELGFKIQFLIHGVHHQYPKDEERLVMPVAVSGLVAIAVWLLMEAVIGSPAYALFPGFVFGYLCYDMIHFSIHHFKTPRSPVLKTIWLHHLDHHYRDPGNGFGVSSPLWDWVFRTAFPSRGSSRSR